MSDKVVSLNGGSVSQPGQPNANCVEALEAMLERARSGDVQGVAIICNHYDNSASKDLSGLVGGFSMLGACQMVCHELSEVNKPDEDYG